MGKGTRHGGRGKEGGEEGISCALCTQLHTGSADITYHTLVLIEIKGKTVRAKQRSQAETEERMGAGSEGKQERREGQEGDRHTHGEKTN